MRWVSSLYTQSLCLLALYILLQGMFAFFIFNAQSGIGWDAVVKSPACDRLDTIGDAIAATLRSTDRKQWNTVLNDFGNRYGCEFFLFNCFNQQEGGRTIELPPEVNTRLKPFAFGAPPPFFVHFEDGKRPGAPFVLSKMPPPPPPGQLSQLQLPPAPIGHPHKVAFRFGVQSGQNLWVGVAMFIAPPDHPPMPGILLACTNNPWQSSLLFDFPFAIKVLAGLLLFSLAFWLPFLWRIVHQLSTLTSATERIADGEFNVSLAPRGNDELARLTASISRMSQRLHTFVERQKFLLADISHELVTPVARLDLAVEVLDSATSNDERTQLMSEIRSEVKEMHLLIDELLAFTKAGIKGKDLQLCECSLLELVMDVHECLAASERVVIDIPQDIEVWADPILLKRAISNVLRNSLRYAPDGDVRIIAAKDSSSVHLSIDDNGPGVPPEVLEYLCEPFYRPDIARNRNSGGAGLGLAIVKNCIEACGGSVQIANRKTGGLQLTMTLQEHAS